MRITAAACAALAALLSACTATAPSPDTGVPSAAVIDGHNARNALDWNGTYEGTLPCADCPGILTRLTLNPDQTYVLHTQYLGRQPQADAIQGSFEWLADGTRIRLNGTTDAQLYFVAEGRLIRLQTDGTRPDGPLADAYVLTRTAE